MDMEIESSGRSVDRSRELSIKKPRMAVAVGDDADKERDRGFQRYGERERSLERPLAQRGSPMMERMRAIERERERERDRESEKGGRIIEDDKNMEREREDTTTTTTTSSRGGGSQHELVSQYKTALAELTFNSKPIITNLTIIAGENSHAAKGIAATVCSHILEVPNEQKLPSLYLLDSIVKNIGGDYVKYFAARLPEVFCKAYRQVDPVTHPGMQHLFRTWKGVFPPAPLHAIEEELRFPSMNGTSSGTTTPRSSDTQSQRPGHSIHVNPKYLEARERLQQSSKAERLNSESTGDEPLQESDRSDRLERNMRASPKGWLEAPIKRPNIQRPPRGDTFGEPIYAQKPSTGYADYDYGMDHVRSSELLSGRSNERITDRNDGLERPWYGERLGEIQSSNTGETYSQRNGYDWQKMPARGPPIDAYGNIRGPKITLGPQSQSTAPHDIGNRSNRVLPRNWQNSEEEEYMWEDTSTRFADAGRGSDKMRKGDWFPGDTNKPLGSNKPLGLGRGKRMEPEPDLPDGHWRTVGPLSQMDQPMGDEGRIPRKELDDRLASPLLHHNVGACNSREASVEGSFLRTAQNSLVHRSQPGWAKQNLSPSAHSRPRVLPMDLQSSMPSLNAVQSEGHTISPFSGGILTSIEPSSETRVGLRTSNGFGTGPPSFGPLPPVTPLSTGLSSRQRQSPRPPSPSALLSAQQLPGSPTSLPRQQSVQPVQHQQQINLSRAGHLQVKTHTPQSSQFLQQSHMPGSKMQQVLQPQNTSDSSNQLPHGYVHSGSSLQHLQMAQDIQISQQFQNRPSGMPPQQGQSLQFLKQATGEPPLLHVQSVSLPQPLVPSHPPQQPDLKSTPQPPPPSYGPPQTPGFSGNGFPTNASSSLQGQTQNLLEVILNSGLLPPSAIQTGSTAKINPSSGYSGFSEFGKSQPLLNIQPPLPSGPPPVQFSTSTVSSSLPPIVSLPIPTPASSLPGPSAVSIPLAVNNLPLPPRPVQPPLPPGPPPASSLVGSSSQATSSVTPPRSSILPVSNLLNSLMAKGIISAPTESTSLPASLPATSLMPNQLNNCSTGVVTTGNLQASVSVPVADHSPVVTAVATPSLETSVGTLSSIDPVGVEFKRERILERHASVINALYDDFPQQCTSCGLRFISHEEHTKHMDWHASKNCERKIKMSHGWFSCLNNWVSGTGPSVTEVASSVFPLELNKKSKNNEEPAVPSDENQLICPLCEELFEEFYSHETDEWMCKGTVYLNVPPGGSTEGMDQSLLGPIVHEKCRSGNAAVTLRGSEENDLDDDDDLECRRKTVQY